MATHHTNLTRRGLLGTAAAALAAPAFAARRLSPSDKVNVAVIGAGGQGGVNMTKLTDQNIVATCDVDYNAVWRGMLDKRSRLLPGREALRDAYDRAPTFSDYRKMFDTQKDIDAVLIATPDHHHAVAARMAMERGIHVYVQKPLTYTVEEGRRLLALVVALFPAFLLQQTEPEKLMDGDLIMPAFFAVVLLVMGTVRLVLVELQSAWMERAQRPVPPAAVAAALLLGLMVCSGVLDLLGAAGVVPEL